MQIVAFECPPSPLLVHSASGGYHWNSIMAWKGTKGKEGQGYLLRVALPRLAHNKAHRFTRNGPHTSEVHIIKPVFSHKRPSVLSEEQAHIWHQNISNDIFGVWERISIRQILQRLKLQRRAFDIWSPSLAWPLQQFTKHIWCQSYRLSLTL